MKIKNLVNQSFGRLTVIGKADNPKTRANDSAAYWKCTCQCGKEITVRGYSLSSGKTKSCGCLSKECKHLDHYKLAKLSHSESAARELWKRSYGRYAQIDFNQFFNLIQQKCYYCGINPNLIKMSKRKSSQPFYYHTLDRMDSNLDHAVENVVPCCLICNRAKLTRSSERFQQYLVQLKERKHLSLQEYRSLAPQINLQSLNKQYISLVRFTYQVYKMRKEITLELDDFFHLTQMDCYYCGEPPGNQRKHYYKHNNVYNYNGLDRIDSRLTYQYDNVITCCKYCNFAKGNLSLAEFIDWISRIKNF